MFSREAIVTESGAGSNGYTEALTTWKNQNTSAELTKAKLTELSTVTKFVF